MVILDNMNDLILLQGRYPEIFMLITLLEVCQEWGIIHVFGHLEDDEGS